MMGYTNIEGRGPAQPRRRAGSGLIVKLAAQYFSDLPWRFPGRAGSRRLTMGKRADRAAAARA